MVDGVYKKKELDHIIERYRDNNGVKYQWGGRFYEIKWKSMGAGWYKVWSVEI